MREFGFFEAYHSSLSSEDQYNPVGKIIEVDDEEFANIDEYDVEIDEDDLNLDDDTESPSNEQANDDVDQETEDSDADSDDSSTPDTPIIEDETNPKSSNRQMASQFSHRTPIWLVPGYSVIKIF
ncbi:hypothetical protein CSKR_203026 [Clonorchis sinensis]|uniref:Uncharacterized protein n=1 Tax=Clonorchis sinensis TaxID=79923 RepID=A0A8T1M6M5_CLOSI|nr:hypothetical protein CSKR_203026 [Clonorchis sinensis]